MGKAEGLIVR